MEIQKSGGEVPGTVRVKQSEIGRAKNAEEQFHFTHVTPFPKPVLAQYLEKSTWLMISLSEQRVNKSCI